MPADTQGRGRGERMGTNYRPQERRALSSFRKVSKPLMEKKRRARINLSLEQLKALLEKHYSHQIRKRKLEKADILELSVKYMKSLQHPIPQGPPPPPRSAEYQAGFRSCAQGVRQFLLRCPEATGDRPASFQLLHELARALPPAGGGGGPFSTSDSGAGAAAAAAAAAGPGAHEVALPPAGRGARPPEPRPGGARRAPGGGWGRARSERGPGGRGPPEGGPGLWRPW